MPVLSRGVGEQVDAKQDRWALRVRRGVRRPSVRGALLLGVGGVGAATVVGQAGGQPARLLLVVAAVCLPVALLPRRSAAASLVATGAVSAAVFGPMTVFLLAASGEASAAPQDLWLARGAAVALCLWVGAAWAAGALLLAGRARIVALCATVALVGPVAWWLLWW